MYQPKDYISPHVSRPQVFVKKLGTLHKAPVRREDGYGKGKICFSFAKIDKSLATTKTNSWHGMSSNKPRWWNMKTCDDAFLGSYEGRDGLMLLKLRTRDTTFAFSFPGGLWWWGAGFTKQEISELFGLEHLGGLYDFGTLNYFMRSRAGGAGVRGAAPVATGKREE